MHCKLLCSLYTVFGRLHSVLLKYVVQLVQCKENCYVAREKKKDSKTFVNCNHLEMQ